MDVNVYYLVQSQSATAVVDTKCVWGKTEHAPFKKRLYNVWLDQTEWSRNKVFRVGIQISNNGKTDSTYLIQGYYLISQNIFIVGILM